MARALPRRRQRIARPRLQPERSRPLLLAPSRSGPGLWQVVREPAPPATAIDTGESVPATSICGHPFARTRSRRRCTAARRCGRVNTALSAGVWSMKQSFETPGGELTAREIAQQPDVWLDIAALVERERTRLKAFLAPALANPRIRVVLTGAGTSSYIGACLAPALAQHLGRRVEAVATTDLVSGPHLYLQRDVPTLLVSFARSGGSPESVAAIDVAQRALDEVHHLVITCNAEGLLATQMSGESNACV